MRLELEFEKRRPPYPPTARVVLGSHIVVGGRVSVTSQCMSMEKLEDELQVLERAIQKIRTEAQRKFQVAEKSS